MWQGGRKRKAVKFRREPVAVFGCRCPVPPRARSVTVSVSDMGRRTEATPISRKTLLPSAQRPRIVGAAFAAVVPPARKNFYFITKRKENKR